MIIIITINNNNNNDNNNNNNNSNGLYFHNIKIHILCYNCHDYCNSRGTVIPGKVPGVLPFLFQLSATNMSAQ